MSYSKEIISARRNDYFMGRACTEKDLRAMWVFNLRYFCKEVRLNATGGREWYGYNPVVTPEAQGKHLATKLFLPMLEYCRAQGRPVYLETHLEKNTSIYKHFGFSIASDDLMPGTDLRHYGMVLE